MTTTVSTKGQVVLPKRARTQLRLTPGTALTCRVDGDSIILTPVGTRSAQPRRVKDRRTGLIVTESPQGLQVSSADIRAALADFP